MEDPDAVLPWPFVHMIAYRIFLTNPAWRKELSLMKPLAWLLAGAPLERKVIWDHG